MEQDWEDSGSIAIAFQLGRVWRDGLGVIPDDEKAEVWFQRAAEAGHSGAQYSLAKLLLQQGRINEAISWFEQAAENGSQFASYQLGKLYLQGIQGEKDIDKSVPTLVTVCRSGSLCKCVFPYISSASRRF